MKSPRSRKSVAPPAGLCRAVVAFAAIVAATTTTWSSVQAEHDSNSYVAAGGYHKRGKNNAMYWREPGNVLQDLSKFKKLYVTYHNCA